jgi:hypothetical protein
MTYAFFMTIDGPEELAARVRDRIEQENIPAFREQGQVNFVSLFAPFPGQDDPFVDDGKPPSLVIQIDADDLGHVATLFDDDELIRQMEGSVSCEAFETLSYPIQGASDQAPRTAPISFNVRYYAPIEGEKQFVDHYLESHPPILGELPGVRNVLCYVPVNWACPLPVTDCLLGNEVTFDTLDGLNEALASNVRLRLREDYNAFPIRPGPNTHYTMQRRDFMIG